MKTGEFVQKLKDEMDQLIPKYAKIDYIMQESIFMAGMEIKAPIVIKLHGPDIEKLNNLADEVVKKISPIKGLYGVENKAPKKSKETIALPNGRQAELARSKALSTNSGANKPAPLSNSPRRMPLLSSQ